MTHADGSEPAQKQKSFFAGYLIDAIGPLVAYAAFHALGVSPVLAMIVGGLTAIVSTVVNSIRGRKLDKFGVLVLVEIGVAVLIRNPRFLMLKPSAYSAAAGIFILSSLVRGRPLSYDGAKPMATQGDPERTAAYERAWDRSPEFRTLHRTTTFGLGIASLADAILRVVVVVTAPLDRAIWLAGVPHIVAAVALTVFCARHGRRSKVLVEEELRCVRTAGRR